LTPGENIAVAPGKFGFFEPHSLKRPVLQKATNTLRGSPTALDPQADHARKTMHKAGPRRAPPSVEISGMSECQPDKTQWRP
jgi:hypothetical protein